MKKHLISVAVLLLFAVFAAGTDSSPGGTATKTGKAATKNQGAKPKKKTTKKKKKNFLVWRYKTSQDDMGRGEIRNATVRSKNTVNFAFPYNGVQRATLMLRKHPKYGEDVIVSVKKGQILCRSHEDCLISVTFDGKKPSKYSAVGAADGSTISVFVRNNKRFIGSLRSAKGLFGISGGLILI